ncbi:MAG: di-trans,poly-cis-decaprenylcistransferase [Flavobacteriaceae bacterium]|nr:di-trans,poly-cis-decaprenylcistransferase [Flavobacteriaceae bacterium]|tara:strand:+ start:1598 stop:2338 length:741 start_codon:yes stop_codon:yes gene_type:complete
MIIDNLDKSKLPNHIAIIMDGNGRWAAKKGLSRTLGHNSGVESVQEIVEEVLNLNIPYLTLYAFSSDNWNRPPHEIGTLMDLLVESLKTELKKLIKNNIRLNTIGDISALPKLVQNEVKRAIDITKNNNKMVLTIALSYGAREELENVIKEIASEVKNNTISLENIDQSIINKHLYTRNLPDVDLLIRTSGEQRISNFLLWQIAYAELYFTDVLWPDFRKKDLYSALLNYQNRERRFGKTSEQINV